MGWLGAERSEGLRSKQRDLPGTRVQVKSALAPAGVRGLVVAKKRVTTVERRGPVEMEFERSKHEGKESQQC
jgi:hypothetical protein